MNTNREHLRHARALRDDILAAPSIWIPRRAVLLEWLDGFVRRAEVPAYDLGESEAEDLTALDRFLRTSNVPSLAA